MDAKGDRSISPFINYMIYTQQAAVISAFLYKLTDILIVKFPFEMVAYVNSLRSSDAYIWRH